MSPLRLTNRRPGNAGAPLVTPVNRLARPPTIGGTKPTPRKRRGATCDARQRFDTPADRLARPPTDWHARQPIWRNQTAAVPHIPACHPGDMNVAPTIDKLPPGKRRGATCDARRPIGTPANGLTELNCRPGNLGAPLVTPDNGLAELNCRPRNVGAPLVTPADGLAERHVQTAAPR